jgi:hypothetical protein
MDPTLVDGAEPSVDDYIAQPKMTTLTQKLSELLGSETGVVQKSAPTHQRPFFWETKQVRALMDDLTRIYNGTCASSSAG